MAKITRRGMCVLLMGNVLTLLTTALWAAPKLLSGSIDAKGNQTHIILKANGELNYHYFTLTNPDRLVIDIKGILQNNVLLDLVKKVSKDDYFVDKIRIGQQNAQTVRVVFDLKRPALAKISKDKNNLIIQLQPNKQAKSSTKNEQPSLLDWATNASKNQPVKRQPVVVIDAGHGGKDPGATGAYQKTLEKNVALQFSLATKAKLEKKGYKVYLTRQNDQYIRLPQRRKKAHDVNADVFVSIHANATENNPMARGSSVYIWAMDADSDRARKLAESENGSDADVSGVLERIKNDNARQIYNFMQFEQVSGDSARLGNNIINQIAKHNTTLRNTVDGADLAVLRSLDIPSVLVELAFLSNEKDEKLLNDSKFRDKMTNSIVEGIDAYFKDPKTILK